ncbi:hypothetical protein ACEXQB_016475 [Herbiconiux sp. P18]|uniref:hypothetical protein n=1 Tax=Herbiconiux liangxiaofengii TaxID=3342795 RepID=UPI0035BB17F3
MTLDTGPLTGHVDRPALRAFRRTLPSTVRPSIGGIVGRAVLMIVFPALLLASWLILIDGSLLDDGGEWDWALTGILFPYAIPPVIGIVVLVRAVRRRSGVRQFRLQRFAEANGFTYEARTSPPLLPGMIFNRPGQSSAFVTDRLRRSNPPTLDVGNHTCTIGSGKNSSTYRWGYAALRLPVALPHIVLDARGNNSLRRPRLPVAFARGQRLSLEGDFDRYFTLYCPEGYEADALYLFSPDVMDRFIDTASRLDVEIVDDHLFLYAPGRLVSLDPEAWESLLATVEVLSAQLVRWERWRDDRLAQDATSFGGASVFASVLGPGSVPMSMSAGGPFDRPSRGVARPGRRLSLRQDWWWLLGAAFALFGLVNLVTDVIDGLTP